MLTRASPRRSRRRWTSCNMLPPSSPTKPSWRWRKNWRKSLPAANGVVHAMNAYCYRCPLGKTYPSCEVACAKDVESVIQTSTSGQIAAFLAEPIQGVGGFITPPKEYFKIVYEIVKK